MWKSKRWWTQILNAYGMTKKWRKIPKWFSRFGIYFISTFFTKEFLELYTQSIFVFNCRSNSVPNLYLDKLEGNLEIK